MRYLKSQIIAVYDTNYLEFADDGFKFRIEVHKRLADGMFFANVFRLEFYRIQPTFPQDEGEPKHEPADEQMHVLDVFFDEKELSGASVEECLEKVERKLAATFPDINFDTD